ncbi:MAG: dTDP-4-dehydrorhamnose 3,5-epimerase [Saprospiraceae bacterium]|nr:dTDP-4-dehydrorhamnose 3,5-epimerase [Saprospiraceae bacterium]
MHINATEIKGVYTIDVDPFEDNRGWFARLYCRREFAAVGLHEDYVQVNQSVTHRKGSIRGMHYQLPPHAEVKLVRCLRGAVYDVAIDLRKGSPTFLNYYGLELSESNRRMIYIPKGFAHGFQTLTDECSLIYQHSAFYEPTAERGIRYDDPVIKIKWPLTISDISEKDKNLIFIDRLFDGIHIL